MNRENKRKLYDKHYYKTHPCDEAFTCKRCGRLVVPEGAGSDHRNHCPYCLCSVHLDKASGDREADCAKAANGRCSTAVGCAARFTPTASRRMITRCC